MNTAPTDHQNRIPEPNITRFLFADTRTAPVWLILRLWLGYEWLKAALGKWTEGGWVGEGAGGAVKGFAQGAMAQHRRRAPPGHGVVASFLENVVGAQRTAFSYLVILGETLVGIALVLGLHRHSRLLRVFDERQLPVCRDGGGQPARRPLVAIRPFWPGGWPAGGGLDRRILPATGVPGAPGSLFGRVLERGRQPQ